MTSHTDDIRALLREADKLPNESAAKMNLIDEAVRRADLHNETQLGIAARLMFIHAGAAQARGDAIAVAFNWCLHQYDRQPDLFAGRDLFHEYSLVIGRVVNFDTLSREQLESLIADYGRRLVAAGEPEGRLWIEWLLAAGDLGDRDLGARAAAELRRLRQEGTYRDGLWFKHHLFMGDDAAALRWADEHVLAPGKNHRFDRIWFGLPMLLLRLGRSAEARKWQKRARGLVVIHDNYYWVYGQLSAAMALSGELAEAVALCARCQRALSPSADPLSHLHFHSDMVVVWDRLHALGTETVLARFTDAVPGRLPNGKYVVAEVRDWLRRNATELAARFDRRNANDFFTRELREHEEWQRFAVE